MKNRIWMIVLPLVLIIGLTGCGVAPGGQEVATEGEAAHAKPLDPAAWPTPAPTRDAPTPTPFPIVTLAPAEGSPPAEASTPDETSTQVGALDFGNFEDLVQQVTSLSGGYPPVAAAAVQSESVDVRQGPATSSDSLGAAQPGELAAVLGKNGAGDWLYVLTRSGLQGWLPADALQITFSLGEAPVLPDDPARAAAPASAVASPLGGLEPAAVAVVTASNVAFRQGPAASYSSAGAVEPGELAGVLGTNAGRDWLYVITLSGAQGWLPADALRVMGSLEEAPVLPANPLAAGVALAPLSEPGTGQPQGLPLPATNATSGQPLALSDLVPVAEARVDNEGLNLRQGPGAAYERLATLARGDQVTVLALNRASDWVLVKTADGQFGWVSVDYLAVDVSLDGAPRVTSPAPGGGLPAGQVAPAFLSLEGWPAPATLPPVVGPGKDGRMEDGRAEEEATPAANSQSSNPPIFQSSSSFATAHANRANVYLYRGPGTSYQPIVTLSVDETVSVLAINQAGDWALVKPADTYKSPGWGQLEQLTVDGSLANAPQVLTAWVESNELAIRRGPGIYYEQTGSLAINDMVAVQGVDQGRAWALVKPVTGGGQGWLPLNFLTLTGSWEDVPEAAAPPVQPASAPANQVAPSALPTEGSVAGQAQATTGPGKLVFQTSSGGDIMVINPDGSDLQRLTSGIDPVLSPDGRTIAFTRWTGEDGTVWLINLDGSNERPLLGETKQAKHPAWSPDGQRLVVNFQHEGRLDPKEACQNLIDLGDKRPSIPFNVDPDSVEVKIKDGRPFLCWTLPPDPHWGLRVVDVAGGSYQDAPSDSYAFGPEWDPANGWRIVSSGLNGLVQLDVNQSEQWSLSDRREDHTPTFSPDGRYLAVAYNNNGTYDIHRLNADGSGRLALTKTPLWVTAQPDQTKPWNNVSPAWSPDGSRIAFLTDRTGRWEIWVMNADGSDPHPMFPAEVNDQLQLTYNFVDERMLSWR